MEKQYKTFEDLEFKPWGDIPITNELTYKYAREVAGAKQAIMDFPNGYGVSVIIGTRFYSNGFNTYEVAIRQGNNLTFSTPITDDVLGWKTAEEVTEIMRKVQEL